MSESVYYKNFDPKYLVSGPAPLGRILNYIKRIQQNRYKRSIRGQLGDFENLDNWTICFMVGLGFIKEAQQLSRIKFKLTNVGMRIFDSIKDMPDFLDRPGQSKIDMLYIKNQLKKEMPSLYSLLRTILLKTTPLKNLAIFFQKNRITHIDRQRFYRQYARVFGIHTAGFNRVPSLVQIAEFCDVLIESGSKIYPYDSEYINSHIISKGHNALMKCLKGKIETAKIDVEETDSDIDDFMADSSEEIVTRSRKAIVRILNRQAKLSKRLKALYKGRCQICGFTFLKNTGGYFSEAHHIIPLGKKGSDNIKNMIILCANCHRIMHYGRIIWRGPGSIEIDGTLKRFRYEPIHLRAGREADIPTI